jgi:cyclase
MSFPRLIPIVTLLGDQAVKTKEFKTPKYVGDPVNTTALLSSFEVEELIILDISRSFESRPVNNATLVQIIENAFMPIAYGGGIASYLDAENKFNLGFDKIVLRSNLFKSDLPLQIAESYGSQAVSGCLDVSYPENHPTKMIVNGEEFEISHSEKLLVKVAKLGIGELIIQDIDRDGTRFGLREHPLLSEAVKILEIPVVPLGGCNSVEDAAQFLKTSKSHSIAASTMFLFRPTREAILVTYPSIDDWHALIKEKL